MQCLRDQEALVPKPRGSLPKMLAAATAAMTTGGIAFQCPERLFGLVAMVTLILTLGPLVNGLFLLVEEMLNHKNTRYRGGVPGSVLQACGWKMETLLAAGLSAFLLYRDEAALPPGGWILILLASGQYGLLKTLGLLGPSEVELLDTCERRKMNVAHGLAWSFYLGYLRLVLPRLDDSITAFKARQQLSKCMGWTSRRLFILVPLDANITHKLEEEDSNIRFYDNLPNNEINRAGVMGRVYKHSIYMVMDENQKAHECVLEYATPLLTLYNMSHESNAGLGAQERRQQALLFYTTLRDILESSLECRNHYTLVLLPDKCVDDPHSLSKAILRYLKQQEKEEFYLCPTPQQEMAHNHQHIPPMSTDPTLMFSLDKPQSLKENS